MSLIYPWARILYISSVMNSKRHTFIAITALTWPYEQVVINKWK